jgi:hypothetical protein
MDESRLQRELKPHYLKLSQGWLLPCPSILYILATVVASLGHPRGLHNSYGLVVLVDF